MTRRGLATALTVPGNKIGFNALVLKEQKVRCPTGQTKIID